MRPAHAQNLAKVAQTLDAAWESLRLRLRVIRVAALLYSMLYTGCVGWCGMAHVSRMQRNPVGPPWSTVLVRAGVGRNQVGTAWLSPTVVLSPTTSPTSYPISCGFVGGQGGKGRVG